MSTKYKDVLDGFNDSRYPCIIYVWNPHVKSNLMLTIRKIGMIRNVLQVQSTYVTPHIIHFCNPWYHESVLRKGFPPPSY